ncbi:hypothetical protein EDC04DRAFT_2604363 [Pisolithus marmoratus]|nr:hypothetical protein EDC04DRAFT_2604363 [Pisolithus marmoratus]
MLVLKVALIEAMENWGKLMGGSPQCLVMLNSKDVHEMMKLDVEQRGVDVRSIVDETLEVCWNMIGFGPEGWVPTEHYEKAMTHSKQLKEDTLGEARSEGKQVQPLDDMEEEEYM